MKPIVEKVIDSVKGIEYWTRTLPICTQDNLARAQFIVYSVIP